VTLFGNAKFFAISPQYATKILFSVLVAWISIIFLKVFYEHVVGQPLVAHGLLGFFLCGSVYYYAEKRGKYKLVKTWKSATLFFACACTAIILCCSGYVYLVINLDLSVSLLNGVTVNFVSAQGMISNSHNLFMWPLLEEILFRVVLFRLLLIKLDVVYALVLQALLFAIAHSLTTEIGTNIRTAHLFIAGMTLGILYLQTRSIFFVVSIHIIWNTYIFFVSALIPSEFVWDPDGLVMQSFIDSLILSSFMAWLTLFFVLLATHRVTSLFVQKISNRAEDIKS
jgi:membrane protease YdiL (CAAX protease family)